MKLIISNVSGIPIYEQIKQQIKAAILSGELQAEETLPSCSNSVYAFVTVKTLIFKSLASVLREGKVSSA